MKKLYTTYEWKQLSKRRSLRELKRKKEKKQREIKRRRSLERRGLYVEQKPYRGVKRKRDRDEITAPSVFSLTGNVEETLHFFHEVNNIVKNHHNVYFDLSKVASLTTDAILYILSRIEYNRSHNLHVNILGNEPKDDKCNSLFQKSGFFTFVKSARSSEPVNDANTFSIKSGLGVNPSIADEATAFALRCLRKKKSRSSRSIYRTIIECMGNVDHAYEEKNPYRKWWLMAYYDKDNKKVHFTFLDNGYTIPTTIKKKYFERIKEIIKLSKDGELIYSALLGKFRSRTGESHRGNGLPFIRKAAKQGTISNLRILSRSGLVNCTNENDAVENINKRFHGTMLCWDFE